MENLIRIYLGDEVYLFTTDTIVDQAIQCGSSAMTSSVYTTIDFGAGISVSESFGLQRKHQPHGPYVCILTLGDCTIDRCHDGQNCYQ